MISKLTQKEYYELRRFIDKLTKRESEAKNNTHLKKIRSENLAELDSYLKERSIFPVEVKGNYYKIKD